METLSRREEDALMKSTKAQALKDCEEVVRAFAMCATGRTISILWGCQREHKAVQECMKTYLAPERMEELRQEYIRQRDAHKATSTS